jgi:hypothetical protein
MNVMTTLWLIINIMLFFQRPFHYSFLQWTHNHHMVKNHGKVVNCTHKIIWIHVTLWIWYNEARFVAHEWVNELKVHFTKVFRKTLHGFVFSKHFLIFFVMIRTTHISWIFLYFPYKDPHLSLQVGSLWWCSKLPLLMTSSMMHFHFVTSVSMLF